MLTKARVAVAHDRERGRDHSGRLTRATTPVWSIEFTSDGISVLAVAWGRHRRLAAQKRGVSTVGGLVLGPFTFLRFFVSGIVSANEQLRKCLFCAEWIRREATVCKHCHRDVPPLPPAPPQGMSRLLKGVLILAALFFGLIASLLLMQ